ncbi:hypothetical protein AAEX28_09010 [Lentisphaerota bacterium WC36G]|nr:hypothetical protein LJT99_11860 [Lentisphaerae bacterium WC36]
MYKLFLILSFFILASGCAVEEKPSLEEQYKQIAEAQRKMRNFNRQHDNFKKERKVEKLNLVRPMQKNKL